jgi:hypothetical protein
MMVVSWLQKETNCKAQDPFILQVINGMVYKIIIADFEDHCIQGPLPLPCNTERAVCIQMCVEAVTCAK